ncbi:MAG: (S)-ureidoglycine aminohydrolase [Pyramidobacter sp.]|nr:(S)-ureidoglycine aminohydrolase [Pyramidobacter sp.]
MGYPKGLLSSRAVVKNGVYSIIPPEGRVLNVIPGFEGFKTSIIASPKYGPSFVQYVSTVEPGAHTTRPWGGDGVETFVCCFDGDGALTVTIGDETQVLAKGGYAYAPADKNMSMRNDSGKTVRILMYKQRYIPVEGASARTVFGDYTKIPERIYDDMANVYIQDFLPTDIGFDMNFHILSFEPGGCHPFVETHVQEHGAYITSGEGVYLLDDEWIPVQKEDFIWMGAFCKQCVYASGRERLSYIYSKDCNRDVDI